jgi:predicted nuclease of predicted toxin-antitoxin system
MNMFADESVAAPIILRLRSDGHTVLSIRELAPGSPDIDVLNQARQASSVLLTEDKDFGELVYRDKSFHHGIVLIRLAGLSRERRAELVSQVMRDHATELSGSFTVISAGGARIRRIITPSNGDPS